MQSLKISNVDICVQTMQKWMASIRYEIDSHDLETSNSREKSEANLKQSRDY